MQGAGGAGVCAYCEPPQRSRLPVFENPEGFENWLLFSSDVAFTFRCKTWATAFHFNLFARSTMQIPANSQTQNLGLLLRRGCAREGDGKIHGVMANQLPEQTHRRCRAADRFLAV